MENEFGEYISEAGLDELVERIKSLPRERIDELWFSVGFIVSDREPGNKALRNSDLDAIKDSREGARKGVVALIAETRLNGIETNLCRIEREIWFGDAQFFEAKVLEFKSFTQYEGHVYDQEVVIELDNGQKITLFDQMHAKKELIGKRVSLEISALIYGAALKAPERKKEIISRDGYATVLQGEITITRSESEPDEHNNKRCVLDAETAKIICYCDSDAHVGDFVVYPDKNWKRGYRLDLESIKEI